mgnify:CR=1 FL=1
MEYVMNELDRMDIENEKKIKKLNEMKSKTIKELIYNNSTVPSKWTKKIDYTNLMNKIVSSDEKLITYLGTQNMNKEKDKYNEKVKEKIKIKENGRVDYPNYLRQHYKVTSEAELERNVKEKASEDSFFDLKNRKNTSRTNLVNDYNSIKLKSDKSIKINQDFDQLLNKFDIQEGDIDMDFKPSSTFKVKFQEETSKNNENKQKNKENSNNDKKRLDKKSIISDFYMGNSLHLEKNLERLKSSKKSVKQRFIQASKTHSIIFQYSIFLLQFF